MQELFPLATPEVAEKTDWVSIANDKTLASSFQLHQAFSKAAKIKREAGDVAIADVLELSAAVYSMRLTSDNPSEPFKNMWQMGATRSALVTDFTDQNLDVLTRLEGKSSNAAANARLADTLWQRRKDRKHAEAAIEAYLAHAKGTVKMDNGNTEWLDGRDSLERAAQLCTQLGRPQKWADELVKAAEGLVDLTIPEPKDYRRPMLLEVISKHGLISDGEKWSEAVDALAAKTSQAGDYEKARRYWDAAVNFARYIKNQDKQKTIKGKQADSYVEEARWFRKQANNPLMEADRYSKAIEACRRVGGRRDLINELHAEMNEAQKKSLGELKRIETSIDLTPVVKEVREKAERLSPDELLVMVAKMAAPSKKADLRARAEKNAKEFVFTSIISGVSLNDKGRVVARTSPTLSSDEDTREAGLQTQMILNCVQHQGIIGISQIEIAREEMERRFSAQTNFFGDLLSMNPFVPIEREEIFHRGLIAGLRGDWLVCAHLLIPQIENSVRSTMEESGLIVNSLDSEHIQMEHDLNTLLYKPETEKVFGEDLVFAMRALLVEQVGANLRNNLAHGLLGQDSFHTGPVAYLWALTIRLCWLGKVLIEKNQSSPSDIPSTANSSTPAES